MRTAGLLTLLLPLITLVKTAYDTDIELTGDFSKYENNPAENGLRTNFLGNGASSQVRKFYVDLENIEMKKTINLVEKQPSPVAVKIFNTNAERAMGQEIDVLAYIRSKGIKEIIPEIYRYGRTNNNSPFIIMELLDGDLFNYIKRRGANLSLEEKFNMYIKLAGLLEKLHYAGIVHCDVKLENIGVIRTVPLTLKLLDFNLSTPAKKCTGGTGGYVAPEITKEDSITGDGVFKSDIYSLGIMLFTIEVGTNEINTLNTQQNDMKANNFVYNQVNDWILKKYDRFYGSERKPSTFADFVTSISLALQVVIVSTLKSDIIDRPTARMLGKGLRCFKSLYGKIETLNRHYEIVNFEDAIEFAYKLPFKIDVNNIEATDMLISDFVERFEGRIIASVNNNKIRLI